MVHLEHPARFLLFFLLLLNLIYFLYLNPQSPRCFIHFYFFFRGRVAWPMYPELDKPRSSSREPGLDLEGSEAAVGRPSRPDSGPSKYMIYTCELPPYIFDGGYFAVTVCTARELCWKCVHGVIHWRSRAGRKQNINPVMFRLCHGAAPRARDNASWQTLAQKN